MQYIVFNILESVNAPGDDFGAESVEYLWLRNNERSATDPVATHPTRGAAQSTGRWRADSQTITIEFSVSTKPLAR
jgi:hypothetical protein